MGDQLNVQDLIGIIKQYKEELSNAMEQKMIFKTLFDKQVQRNQELEKQLAELRQPIENKKADE